VGRAPRNGEATAAVRAEVAAGDRRSRLRDVGIQQLWFALDLDPANGGTTSKMTRRQVGVLSRCRRFTSPSASTTSNASLWKRNQTGVVSAVPSLR